MAYQQPLTPRVLAFPTITNRRPGRRPDAVDETKPPARMAAPRPAGPPRLPRLRSRLEVGCRPFALCLLFSALVQRNQKCLVHDRPNEPDSSGGWGWWPTTGGVVVVRCLGPSPRVLVFGPKGRRHQAQGVTLGPERRRSPERTQLPWTKLLLPKRLRKSRDTHRGAPATPEGRGKVAPQDSKTRLRTIGTKQSQSARAKQSQSARAKQSQSARANSTDEIGPDCVSVLESGFEARVDWPCRVQTPNRHPSHRGFNDLCDSLGSAFASGLWSDSEPVPLSDQPRTPRLQKGEITDVPHYSSAVF
ncbi:hypothetical protein BH23PLA1_BH23PLA1_33900 [soil metagenome]